MGKDWLLQLKKIKKKEPRAIKMAQTLQNKERESEQIDVGQEKILKDKKTQHKAYQK